MYTRREKTSDGLEKITSWEEPPALNLKSHFRDLPVVHVRLSVPGGELLPVEKTILRQKYDDLARKSRVWHLMCNDYPISCRRWVLEQEWREPAKTFLRNQI